MPPTPVGERGGRPASRRGQLARDEEREILLEWIREALEDPELREADRREAGVELFYARIAA